MSARVLWVGLAVAGIGGGLEGCSGKLVPDSPGGAGNGGLGAPGGTTGGGVSGGGGTAFGEPACPEVVRATTACVPTDPQFCYRTCGPEKTGAKAVTCQANGVYSEMAGCSFDPNKDYSCYAIPSVANAVCPAGVAPQGSNPCDVDHCVLCNSAGGLPGGLYTDSSGAPRTGYCTCRLPDATGLRLWSCASDSAWPCPAGAGCGRITGGVGGATGTGGVPGGFGEPACLSTVVKGGACTPADQQFCYKSCGPANTGVKSETCTTAGTYAEMSGCSFPAGDDYSCYKIPSAPNAACPSGGAAPQAGTACAVPPCTLCNSLQGNVGGHYMDAAGAPKIGWCVCQPGAGGLTTWSCASDTAWPCPLGAGC